MTVSVSLGFDPIWSNFNIFGVSAGGASLYSYDSLNPTVFKPIFSDPGANFPYPNPILFDQNGNAPGPFYFTLDSVNPSSLYDLFLYDAQGNLIWNVDSYYPSGGGGGMVNTSINIVNLVTNSVLWRNIGGGIETPPNAVTLGTMTQIAPGAHDGLSFNVAPTPTTSTSNAFGPDVYFFKNNTAFTDTVRFPVFTLGSTTFTNDVTPVQYVNHVTTGASTGEVYKYYQFPITNKVQNLTNQNVTLTIWAQGVSGTQTLKLSFAQFFGDGAGATATSITTIQTLALTSSWTKYQIQTTIPSVGGSNLGPCGNDGLFLLIGMPLDAICEINFAKPSIYLGTISPGADYIVYDNIDAAVNSPRTGDVRTSLNNFTPFGWIPLNDGTIGSKGSSANYKGTDAFPLYNLIWNSVSRAYAPLTTTSLGSAILDFVGNNGLYLTKALGRVLAGTTNTQIVQTVLGVAGTQINITNNTGFNPGDPIAFNLNGGTLPAPLVVGQVYYVLTLIGSTNITLSLTVGGAPISFTAPQTGLPTVSLPPYALGLYVGEEVSFTVANHTHDVPGPGSTGYVYSGTTTFLAAGQDFGIAVPQTTTGRVTNESASNTSPILQPTTYMNMFIKL